MLPIEYVRYRAGSYFFTEWIVLVVLLLGIIAEIICSRPLDGIILD